MDILHVALIIGAVVYSGCVVVITYVALTPYRLRLETMAEAKRRREQ